VLVVPEIEEEQRGREHRELGRPVGPRDEPCEPVALLDELLERQLVEPVAEVRLEPDDLQPVVERLLRVPVCEASSDLIDEQEPEPDRDLAPEIRVSPRQVPPSNCHYRRHSAKNSTSRAGARRAKATR